MMMMMVVMMMMMMNQWTLATFPNMFRENQFWGEPDIQFKQKSYTALLVDAGPIVEVLCGQRMSTMPLCWSLKKCAAVIPTLQVLWDSKSNTLSTSSNVEEFPRTCSHPVGTSKFWTMYSYVFIYIFHLFVSRCHMFMKNYHGNWNSLKLSNVHGFCQWFVLFSQGLMGLTFQQPTDNSM